MVKNLFSTKQRWQEQEEQEKSYRSREVREDSEDVEERDDFEILELCNKCFAFRYRDMWHFNGQRYVVRARADKNFIIRPSRCSTCI